MVAYKGMPKATDEELALMALIKQLPCCICSHPQAIEQKSPTQVHHIVRSKRLGHSYVLPVCEDHHRRIGKYRHLEQQLWEALMERLKITHIAWPESKIVQRRIV
jgi:hypothetical protein